ncbi:MAG TPA: Xaa-Pro peptidase family protein [Acidimicrobiales bacterium]|nr:Xaa-Pro peptidase family protein [Acidimicrobiales bacterium]
MSGAALPPMDVAGRLARLRSRLDGAGCEVLLVTHLTNVRYLSGFTGSAASLVVSSERAALITDGRYEEQAAEELAAAGVGAEVVIGRTQAAQADELRDRLAAAATVGLEAHHVTWAEQRRLADLVDGELVPTEGLVEDLRQVKDDGEVARIEAAARIADAALEAVLPQLDTGPTEAAFAAALDGEMRARGADDVSFETIVASGPNGSRPHHRPGPRRIERGDLVVIDFGALVDGYHSDMTRTIPVGGRAALDATQRRMMDVVTEAQAAGVAAVAAGAPLAGVDAACRTVIEAAGWGDAFVHGTGHGVGLDIHEAPGVNATAAANLVAGQVVTVEPGVYLPGTGGVRVEDTVVVTEGGARPLTCAPKP